MMRGYHMGMGFYGSYILMFILIAIFVLILFMVKNKPAPNPFIIKLIDILKEKYASGVITFDEYIERKSIIEDIRYSSQYIPILLERYAQCVIGSREFLNIKNIIESNKFNIITCEKLAKGEVPYDEFNL